MSTYKLHYFNAEGRAGLARFILAEAGQKYEDCRHSREEWKEMKPNTQFGIMPILEVDGFTLCQSHAICRFLARRFNLAGNGEIEQAQADMIVDCLDDMLQPFVTYYTTKDENKKDELRKKLVDEHFPDFLTKLEKLLISNGGGDGYFVGKSLTWADLTWIHAVSFPEGIKITIDWTKYPKLAALRQRVEDLPRIKQWMQDRPKSA